MPEASVKVSALKESERPIQLKNPLIAGVLGWVFPGLGHWYQGRKAKAVLFAVCIIPIFIFGCYLGSDKEFGAARNVYCSWRPGDKRLFFIPQACLGMAAVPAVIQSLQVGGGGAPFWGGAMAPPGLKGARPSLDEIIKKEQNAFEIGTLFTIVAGLMNLLAMFDAIDGPIIAREKSEEEKKKEKDKEESSAK